MERKEKPRSTRRLTDTLPLLAGALRRLPGVAVVPPMGALAALATLPFIVPGSSGDVDAEAGVVAVSLPPPAAFPGVPPAGAARVEYWRARFLGDLAGTIEEFRVQERVYGALIREKLTERGLPSELLYLAMIESGLRPRATSRVEAAGVWQFMGPTAEAYGLRVDGWVDERRDPVRATDAALDYLGWLFEQYGSWSLAAAAYNAGPTRVNRILREHGWDGTDGDHFYWEIRPALPFETREYIPRLMAVAEVVKALDRLEAEAGMKGPVPGDRGNRSGTAPAVRTVGDTRPGGYTFSQVWMPGGTDLGLVADRLEVERRVIAMLNPHLIQGRTPPGEAFPVRVPSGSAFQAVASLGRGGRGLRRTDD
ncbi:MAG: lytic transglycosylase domain-containing protein [Longimicrobiales bacterium]|nr:lytic transglycosylase domain-containing protein [Longimicrobiales bacterium]